MRPHRSAMPTNRRPGHANTFRCTPLRPPNANKDFRTIINSRHTGAANRATQPTGLLTHVARETHVHTHEQAQTHAHTLRPHAYHRPSQTPTASVDNTHAVNRPRNNAAPQITLRSHVHCNWKNPTGWGAMAVLFCFPTSYVLVLV